MPLRGPLLAGVAAAVLISGGVGLLAWLAGSEPEPVRAGAEISRPLPVETVAVDAEIPFADGPGDEVSLPGVTDSEIALTGAEPETPEPEPTPTDTAALAPRAPLPGLFEPGPGALPLPIISADGIRPDEAYATPFDGVPSAPTIAVIVGGLGLSERLTQRAIETLPADVTLSFAPYADNLQDWIDLARADGHEVLIELPMEPFDYPNNDPGPHTLLSEASHQENERRLIWLLSRAAGYAGVTNYLGARLGADRDALSGVFAKLEDRGLSIFHDGAGRRSVITAAAQGVDAQLAIADRVVDSDPVPDSIDRRLLELEALALQDGDALGAGFAYPATVDTVAIWAESLRARGYQLAPASFLMKVRRERTEPDS